MTKFQKNMFLAQFSGRPVKFFRLVTENKLQNNDSRSFLHYKNRKLVSNFLDFGVVYSTERGVLLYFFPKILMKCFDMHINRRGLTS